MSKQTERDARLIGLACLPLRRRAEEAEALVKLAVGFLVTTNQRFQKDTPDEAVSRLKRMREKLKGDKS